MIPVTARFFLPASFLFAPDGLKVPLSKILICLFGPCWRSTYIFSLIHLCLKNHPFDLAQILGNLELVKKWSSRYQWQPKNKFSSNLPLKWTQVRHWKHWPARRGGRPLWVSGHRGISGNEKADIFAINGAWNHIIPTLILGFQALPAIRISKKPR